MPCIINQLRSTQDIKIDVRLKDNINIDDILNQFVAILSNVPFNDYAYKKIITDFVKINDGPQYKSHNIIKNIKTKMYKNNMIYDMCKNDTGSLFAEYILKKTFKPETIQ